MAKRERTSKLDLAAVVASKAARGGLLWVGAGAILARSRGDRAILLETALSTWLASTVAFAAASMIGRERPCSDGRGSLIDCPERPSFPSEHAAAAFAAAQTLARLSPRLRLVVLPAAAVAASRVKVGVHHRSDVLGGAALGVLVSRAIRPFFRAIN
jgi:undecaprenyl-diphosphatase